MRVVAAVLELLYPPRCPACDSTMTAEAPLCAVCSESLYPTGPACLSCGLPRQRSTSACPRCRLSPPSFATLSAPYRFGGELATALRRLKFRDRPDIARLLAPLFCDELARVAAGAELLVPVPLSWRRRASRRFNQAALLLDYGRRATGIDAPIDNLTLRRIRDTTPQSGLSAADRARNVAGAFAVHPRRAERIRDRRVLLFDDVATTCATLSAAADALLSAGATRVDAVCVARAE